MARTVPVAVRAFTAAAMVVSTVFAPLAPAVQAQGVPGSVRARSCAVGTDTLSSLGVTAGGTITVSDGTTARAVTYTTADTVATVASNVQTALRYSDPIDAAAVVNAPALAPATTLTSGDVTATLYRSGSWVMLLPMSSQAVISDSGVTPLGSGSGNLVQQLFGQPSWTLQSNADTATFSGSWDGATRILTVSSLSTGSIGIGQYVTIGSNNYQITRQLAPDPSVSGSVIGGVGTYLLTNDSVGSAALTSSNGTLTSTHLPTGTPANQVYGPEFRRQTAPFTSSVDKDNDHINQLQATSQLSSPRAVVNSAPQAVAGQSNTNYRVSATNTYAGGSRWGQSGNLAAGLLVSPLVGPFSLANGFKIVSGNDGTGYQMSPATGQALAQPTLMTSSPWSTGTKYTYTYTIGSVDSNGFEAFSPTSLSVDSAISQANLGTTGSNTITWNSDPLAVSYNIYREVGGVKRIVATFAPPSNNVTAAGTTAPPSSQTASVITYAGSQITFVDKIPASGTQTFTSGKYITGDHFVFSAGPYTPISSNTSGTVTMERVSGERVPITYDTSLLTPITLRDTILSVASHRSYLSTATGTPSLAFSDVTGTLASRLGIITRPSKSLPLGHFYSSTDVPDLGTDTPTLDAVAVGNVPVGGAGTSGSTGVIALSASVGGVTKTRNIAWSLTDTIPLLAAKIQVALRDEAISPGGTADFATSNGGKVTIAATGKTLTLSDSNAGATGALAKLNLPTTATASPVVSTATVATSGGPCLDTTPPTVSTITTTASGTKKVNDSVTITVTFSEPVTTTGTSSLLLETGAIDTAATCPAVMASTTLTCTYTVTSGDTVSHLDVQSISALTGTIADAAGNAYVTANGLPALGSSGLYVANITVDGVAPVAPSTLALAGPSDTGVSPSDGITNQTSVTVTGAAEVGSTVALRDGGTPIGGATATATGGAFSITTTLAAGPHTLTPPRPTRQGTRASPRPRLPSPLTRPHPRLRRSSGPAAPRRRQPVRPHPILR